MYYPKSLNDFKKGFKVLERTSFWQSFEIGSDRTTYM